MSVALITGAGGLIGSEAVMFYARKGFDVVGALAGGVNAWPDPLVTTPVIQLADAPDVLALIDVSDPGTALPPGHGVGASIPFG